MAKDILIVPGSSNIHFSGSAVNDIKLETLDSGSVAFTSNSGSLFTITNSFTGSLFSVGDVSGVPILDVNSDDTVTLGQFSSPIKVLTNASSHTIISGSTTSTASFGRVQASTLAGNSPITIDAELKPAGIQTFTKAVYAGPSSENFYRIKLQDQGGTHNDVGIGQGATGNMGFNVGASNYYDFYEGTNGLRFRLINGRIGVGETAPSAMLHISGSGVPTAKFYGLGAANSIVMGYNGSVGQHMLFWDSSKFYVAADENNDVGSSELHLRVDGNDRIVIDVTGESTFTSNNATVEIATTSNGTYGVRSTSPAKFNDYYFSGTTGHIRNTLGTSYMSFDSSGNATIPQNLTVQGSLTAQEFITELNTTTIIATSGSTKFGNDSSDTHAFSGSITSDASIDVLGSIRRRNSRGSNAGLALLTTSSNHGVGEFYSSGGGLNARIHGGGSSFTLNRFGIGHNAPENGGLDIRANHSLGSFSVGDGSGNIYHRYYVSMSGAFGNGTAHHVPRGVPGSGTSNFTTHFKNAVGGGSTEHHVVIDGKVGLGTTSPAGNKLHIHVGDSGTDSVTTNSSLVIESNTNNYIQMLNPNGNNSGIIFGEHNNIDIASILHDGGTNHLSFTVGGGERIRINSSGNVGIGTNNPTQKFHLHGGSMYIQTGQNITWNNGDAQIGAISGYHFRIQTYTGSSLTEKMRVTSGGNVGIGETSPDTKLHIKGAGEILRIENDTNASGNTYMSFHDTSAVKGYLGYTGGSSDHLNIWNVENASVKIATNNTERITVLGGGNVGIGTNTPVSKLHVLGSSYNHLELESASGNVGITFDVETSNTNYYDWRIDAQGTVANGFCIGRSTGLGNQTFSAASMIMTLKSSGDVGIGTTAPSNWLHMAQSTGGNHFNEGIRIVRGEFAGDATQYAIVNNYNGTLNLISRGGSNHGYINLMSSNDGSTTRTMLQIDAREDQYLTPTGSAISYNVKGASGAAHGSGVSGSYVIYRDLAEKSVVHNGNDDYQLMKTFTPTKSGNVTLQFEAYISSGTYYWAFRVGRNGDGRNDSNTGAYQSYDSHFQALMNKPFSVYLDPSNTSSVHNYRKFNVNVRFLRAGETVDLYMVSSDSSGNPQTGNGQTLGLKNFVVRSDSPSAEINPIHSLGKNVGIGTSSPVGLLTLYDPASGDNKLRFQNSTTGVTTSDGTRVGLNGAEFFINNLESSNIKIYTGTTQTQGITIDNSGKVGIGTTAPGVAKLNIFSSTAGGPFLYIGDGTPNNDSSWDTNIMMDSNQHSRLRIEQRGDNKNLQITTHVGYEPAIFAVDSATEIRMGVGGTTSLEIGTNPYLDVKGRATFAGEVEINSNDGIDVNAGAATLNASHSGGTSALYSGYGFSTATSQTIISNANKINFNSPGTTRMVVSSSGYVGIGTTTPTSLLHVESTGTAAQLNIEGVNSNVAATLRFIHNGGGSRTNFDGNWNISRGSSETNFGGPMGALGGLAFWHQTNGGGYVDALRIKDDGNLVSAYKVGIGTTSPVTALLHAYGANNSAGTMWTAVGAGNAPHIVVQNAGTTSNNNAGYFFKDNDGYVGGVGMRFTDHSPNKSKLIFSTANTNTREIGAFNESGSLGVGLTNPEAYESSANNLVVKDYYDGTTAGITIVTGTTSKGKIHFADGTSGNASYRGYIFYDHNSDDGMGFGTSGTTKMFIDGTGNVGINDTTPSFKLDVNGTGRFTGDVTFSTNSSILLAGGGASRIKFNNLRAMEASTDGSALHLGEDFTSIRMRADIRPESNNSHDLGTSSFYWKNLYLNGNIIVNGTVDGVDIASLNTSAVKTSGAQTIAGVKTFSSNINAGSGQIITPGGTNLALNPNTGIVSVGGVIQTSGTGNNTMAGNLIVGGNITAQQFITEYQTETIIQTSGSTKFGNTLDDTHEVTGSLRVTGSGAKVFEVKSRTGSVPVFQINNTTGQANSIGINTTPALGVLDIRTTGQDRFIIQLLNASGTNIGGFYTTGNRGILQLRNSSGAAKVNLDTGGDSYLTGGSVGIGTTSPSTTRRLHIYNTDDTRGIYIENTSATSYAELHLKANREFRVGTGGASSAAEAQNKFYVYDATAAAHRFTIDSSGKVGIGDTDPQAKLHVEIASHNDAVGFYNGATALVYMRNEAGTGRLTLQGSGGTINLESSNSRNSYINTSADFGIGTASPSYKLHVAGTAFATNLTLSGWSTGDGLTLNYGNSTGTVEAVSFKANGGTNGNIKMVMVSANSGDMIFNAANRSNQLTLYRNGKVGIGVTGPNAMLEVKGASGVNDNETFVTTDSSGNHLFEVLDGGKVIFNYGPVEFPYANVRISGSSTSTGSFGRVQIKPSGDARLDIISTTYSELYFNDASNAGILSYNHGSDQFTLYTGGGIRQKINSSTTEFVGANYKISGSSTSTGSFGHGFIAGRLGVNTTSPAQRLHVTGNVKVDSGVIVIGTTGEQLQFTDSNARIRRVSNDMDFYAYSGFIFSNNAGESFRVDNSGNLQIAAGNNVSGSLTSTGSFGHIKALSEYSMEVAEYITHFEDSDTHIRFQNNTVDLSAAGNLFRFNASGVGIGTGTVQSKLHIESGGAGNAFGSCLYLHGDTATNFPAARIDNATGGNASETHGLLINNTAAGAGLRVNSNAMSPFIIKATGRVGIGTDDPTSILHLKEVNNPPVIFVEDSRTSLGDNVQSSGIHFKSNDSTSGGTGVHTRIITETVAGTLGRGHSLFFQTGTEANSTVATRLAITNTGNVGIGDTSPSNKLQIKGGGITVSGSNDTSAIQAMLIKTSAASSQGLIGVEGSGTGFIGSSIARAMIVSSTATGTALQLGSAGSVRMTIASNGNIGIGNTSPAQKLRVEGEIYAHMDVGDSRLTTDSATNSDAQVRFLNGGTLSHVIYADGSDTHDPLRFLDNSTGGVAMSLVNGKLGIGNTNPSHPLDVTGNARVTNNLYMNSYGVLSWDSATAEFRVYATSGNELKLSANGHNNHITIDTTGRVGINQTSPGAVLEVKGHSSVSTTALITHGTVQFKTTENDSSELRHQFNMGGSSDAGSYVIKQGDASTNGIVLAAGDDSYIANNLGIGVASPERRLHVHGSSSDYIAKFESSDAAAEIIFEDNNSTNDGNRIGVTGNLMRIATNNTYRFYIDADGGTKVYVALAVGGITPSTTTGRIDAANDVVAFSTSDERLKENVKLIENPIDKVKQIRGVEFDWKPLTDDEKKNIHGNEGHDVGVIAQDVEKVLPEVVTERDNGYKAVKYEKMVSLLIESVKEQQKQIEELKSEIQELKDGSSS